MGNDIPKEISLEDKKTVEQVKLIQVDHHTCRFCKRIVIIYNPEIKWNLL